MFVRLKQHNMQVWNSLECTFLNYHNTVQYTTMEIINLILIDKKLLHKESENIGGAFRRLSDSYVGSVV